MRIVVITGATSGFGKLMVQSFLQAGDFVVATGRRLNERKDIFGSEKVNFAHRFLELDLDVTNSMQIQNTFNLLEKQFSGIDILINNAGHGLFGALEDLSGKDIRHQMEVNFFGTVEVTKTLLPLLRFKKGKVFNFSSVFGFMGFPLTSLYCASKFAVEGFSESLRIEIAPHGVQVCLIRPGGFETGFGKNLIWGEAEENSHYATQLKNYRSLHEWVSRKKAQDPQVVARGVLALSQKKRLPMTKVYGRDGAFSYLLKTFLPERLYFTIMEIVLSKVFLAKRT